MRINHVPRYMVKGRLPAAMAIETIRGAGCLGGKGKTATGHLAAPTAPAVTEEAGSSAATLAWLILLALGIGAFALGLFLLPG